MGFDFGIGEIAAAASLVGTAVSAVGQFASGNAAAAQANYQAQVAANNAAIAQQNAAYATQAGEVKAADQAMRERAQAGAVRAALAASNLDINSGTPEEVQRGREMIGQTDVERVRQQAALQAYGYRTQATSFQAESGLDRAMASFDKTGALFKAGGTLLSGGANLFGTKFAGLDTTTSGANAMGSDFLFHYDQA